MPRLRLYSLLWRVALLEIGLAYGALQLAADLTYTVGANALTMPELERAAALFPFSHDYRVGPARLIIRDRIWTKPSYAVARLRETMRYDPNSRWLKAWIAAFEDRQ